MSDKTADQSDVEAARQRAYERGVADTLAKVRKLPSPWRRPKIGGKPSLHASCKWCGCWVQLPDAQSVPVHPANDCLWFHAQQAAAPAEET
jgi:hypothetical protein